MGSTVPLGYISMVSLPDYLTLCVRPRSVRPNLPPVRWDDDGCPGWTLRHTLGILAPRRWKQEDQVVRVILSYTASWRLA